ncbi:MAG: endolytic transglycosylase MltG [Betaproteobacteria bacterium]
MLLSSRLWRLAALLLVALAIVAGLLVLTFRQPLDMTQDRVELRIAAGASARGIARQARAAGISVNEHLFIAAARLTDATGHLRAGRYEIARGISLEGLLDKLRRGEVLREKLTIVEGWTVRDLRAALAAHADLRQDSARMSTAELLKAVGASESHPEGLFAPDTYVFDPGSSDLDLLRNAYRAQASRLAEAWARRDPAVPLKTPYEALILASIVEKETGQASERGLVAGVFVNRLRRSMLLQTDPTVIYGLGEKFDGNLRKRDLLADGPYNTYTRAGLPPTPIALPGRAALQATLNPQTTRALYFVARGDGTSAFSETLSEHNRAVARYQLAPARR